MDKKLQRTAKICNAYSKLSVIDRQEMIHAAILLAGNQVKLADNLNITQTQVSHAARGMCSDKLFIAIGAWYYKEKEENI